jgi:shikimate dehydrogenase
MTMHDRYAVIGNPVAHSQSPFIHAEFARQTGQALDYGRLLCAPDGFEDCVRAFVGAGGRGCNVTVPFKFDAPRLAAHCSARAALAQAANVLRFDNQGAWADNTDGVGLVRALQHEQALRGQRVLLIGAGGAAAGALGPLLQARPRAVVVVNRTSARARSLVQRHLPLAAENGVSLQTGALQAPGADFDVVLNASASSLHGAPVPVPADVLARGALAMDLMYGAPAQAFVDWALQAGARAHDGLAMLVEQAAEAFHFWRGVRPQTAPVLRVLRERLAAE